MGEISKANADIGAPFRIPDEGPIVSRDEVITATASATTVTTITKTHAEVNDTVTGKQITRDTTTKVEKIERKTPKGVILIETVTSESWVKTEEGTLHFIESESTTQPQPKSTNKSAAEGEPAAVPAAVPSAVPAAVPAETSATAPTEACAAASARASVAVPTGESAAAPKGESVADPTGEFVAAPTGESAAAPTGESAAAPTRASTVTCKATPTENNRKESKAVVEDDTKNQPEVAALTTSPDSPEKDTTGKKGAYCKEIPKGSVDTDSASQPL